MTSTVVEHRPTAEVADRTAARSGALVRVLVALVVGAAVVLVLAVLRGGTEQVAPPGPTAVRPAPVVPPLDGPVDRLVADPATVPAAGADVRWSEQDGALQRDCSRVHGCGPWYDTSFGSDGPPMDSITEYPPPGGLDTPSTT